MKRMNLRKALIAAAMIGTTVAATGALAESPQEEYGMGFGMMGGQGSGYGMGTGMMGGQASGYGMGPPYMMDGGMMDGCSHRRGMGPGMMGGYSLRSDLNLTAEQRNKISKLQNDVRRKHWEMMGKMQDEQALMNEQYYSDARDDAALGASYRKMLDLRAQMFEQSLSAQKQIDAILTDEQRTMLKSH